MRLLLLLFVTLSTFAQDVARMDQYLSASNKQRSFIGSALVAKGGKVLLEKGYGSANIELDVPNGPDTKFRLGSITKQFTATAIMQLNEQGKLGLDDAACKYLDNCPGAWKPVTIRHLLTHTSGIPSYTNDKQFPTPTFMRIPLSPVEVVMLTKDKPMEFDPGTKWNYDNTGYVLLGVIIEMASGEKYADYLRKHIFDPLEMKDSGYDVTQTILKNRAAGYEPAPGGKFKNAEYLDMSLPHAAGSLYSTTRDLYKWDRALYTEKVVSRASKEAMFTVTKSDYGFGWMLAPQFGHKQIGHGGGINGFSTYVARYPDDDAFVVVLSNNQAGNAGQIARSLAGILFGEKIDLPGERKAISLDTKVLDRYVGTYQVGPMTITVTNENGHLMATPKGQPKAELFAATETKFFLKVVDAEITFTLGADGKATGMQLDQGGATLKGSRVS